MPARPSLSERQAQMHAALRAAAGCFDDSVTTLAKHLGCSTQWLYKNVRRGEFNPNLAVRIEALTSGQVPRARLNPRLFG